MQMFMDQNRAKWIKLADEITVTMQAGEADTAHLTITKNQAVDLIGQGALYTVFIFETGTITVQFGD